MSETNSNDANQAGESVESQAQQQTGQKQVRLRLDQRDMTTSYANAFRTNTTAEEVMLEFGINQVVPTPGQQGEQPGGEILFQSSQRIILNYYTAKRLAMSLGQMIRGYEDRFGELKLSVSDRSKG